LTKVTNSKKEEVEIPSKFIQLFTIEKGVLKGLSPKGITRLTEFLDVRGKEALNPSEIEEFDVLIKFRKKSDRTPIEQVAYEILVAERLKKKMITELIQMQYMWISMHRTSEEAIKSFDDDELRRQYQMHSTLWEDYINKPKAPTTCDACGIQTGKYEVAVTIDGKTEYATDYCRECYAQ
jgi:hypothetical protein